MNDCMSAGRTESASSPAPAPQSCFEAEPDGTTDMGPIDAPGSSKQQQASVHGSEPVWNNDCYKLRHCSCNFLNARSCHHV